MTPECSDQYTIKHWFSNDPELNCDDHEYPSNYSFWNDGEKRRVELNWEGIKEHGKLGWQVGVEDVIVTTASGDKIGVGDLVVWDGERYARSIHPIHILYLS